jgi:hypothetical protein
MKVSVRDNLKLAYFQIAYSVTAQCIVWQVTLVRLFFFSGIVLDKGRNSDVRVFILSITFEPYGITEEELFLNTE